MTEHNNPADATEIERLTKLAEANGQQARFWADHFAEIERANRDALGAHHKPGHSVAELITALIGELADVQESRLAWAIEADRLDVIATEACLVTHPRECGRDESDCTNDDSCPRAEERYATADDLIGAMALSEEVARLTREQDEARAEVSRLERCYDAVKERAERAEARPAIPADVLAKPDGALYALLRVWLDSPLNRNSSESAADAAASAVNWYLRPAPVSGSDTTEVPGE